MTSELTECVRLATSLAENICECLLCLLITQKTHTTQLFLTSVATLDFWRKRTKCCAGGEARPLLLVQTHQWTWNSTLIHFTMGKLSSIQNCVFLFISVCVFLYVLCIHVKASMSHILPQRPSNYDTEWWKPNQVFTFSWQNGTIWDFWDFFLPGQAEEEVE